MLSAIKVILNNYDANKGINRKLFSDQEDIKKLRALYNAQIHRNLTSDEETQLEARVFLLLIKRRTQDRSLSEQLLKKLLTHLPLEKILINTLGLQTKDADNKRLLKASEIPGIMKVIDALRGSSLLTSGHQQCNVIARIAEYSSSSRLLNELIETIKPTALFKTPQAQINTWRYITESTSIASGLGLHNDTFEPKAGPSAWSNLIIYIKKIKHTHYFKNAKTEDVLTLLTHHQPLINLRIDIIQQARHISLKNRAINKLEQTLDTIFNLEKLIEIKTALEALNNRQALNSSLIFDITRVFTSSRQQMHTMDPSRRTHYIQTSMRTLASSPALSWWYRKSSLTIISDALAKGNEGILKILGVIENNRSISYHSLQKLNQNPNTLNLQIADILQTAKGSLLMQGKNLHDTINILTQYKVDQIELIEVVKIEFAKGHISNTTQLQIILKSLMNNDFKLLYCEAKRIGINLEEFLSIVRDEASPPYYWRLKWLLDIWREVANNLGNTLLSAQEEKYFFSQFIQHVHLWNHAGHLFHFRNLKPIYLKEHLQQIFNLAQQTQITKQDAEKFVIESYAKIYEKQKAEAAKNEEANRSSRTKEPILDKTMTCLCEKFGIDPEQLINNINVNELNDAQETLERNYKKFCLKYHPDKAILNNPNLEGPALETALRHATDVFQALCNEYETVKEWLEQQMPAGSRCYNTSTPFAEGAGVGFNNAGVYSSCDS